jgi:hypothetical protein
MNIAVVGCGKNADIHVEEIGKINSARLVAVDKRQQLRLFL